MPPISAFMVYVILQTDLDTFPDVFKKPPINASVIRVILLMNPENSARSFLIAHMAVIIIIIIINALQYNIQTSIIGHTYTMY